MAWPRKEVFISVTGSMETELKSPKYMTDGFFSGGDLTFIKFVDS